MTANYFPYPRAGKTGTTENGWDVWYDGYTPQLAAAVWMGDANKNSAMDGAYGGTYCAPMWAKFFAAALKDEPHPSFKTAPWTFGAWHGKMQAMSPSASPSRVAEREQEPEAHGHADQDDHATADADQDQDADAAAHAHQDQDAQTDADADGHAHGRPQEAGVSARDADPDPGSGRRHGGHDDGHRRRRPDRLAGRLVRRRPRALTRR